MSESPQTTPSAASSGRPELDAALVRAPTPPEVDLEALWGKVAEGTVEARPGLAGRLRELPTTLRVTLAVAAALVVATVTLLVSGHRTDLGAETLARYGVVMVGLFALTGVVFSVGLRGPEAPAVAWRTAAAVAAALGVPVGLALWPDLWRDPVLPAEPPIFFCITPGLVTGLVTAAVVWAMQRDPSPRRGRLIAVMAGGGVAGFAMLQLHCPARDAAHMFFGHASVGFALLLLTGVAAVARRLLRPRP
jgi:hypothetical protein